VARPRAGKENKTARSVTFTYVPTLIDIKSRVRRAKDKFVVAELIVILEERQKK
jgi:hypothetical protein